jgi:hypothetical protein
MLQRWTDMKNTLNGLFLITLIGVFGGLIWNGATLAVSLMLAGPVTISVFLAFSFLYFAIVVTFEKPKRTAVYNDRSAALWRSDALVPQSDS